VSGGLGDQDAGQRRNVLRQGFGGITAACAWADVVVCHGGHSTVLAALAAGKPVVVAPAMSENEANGRQLVEQAGVGTVLATSSMGPAGRLLITARGGRPAAVADGLREAFSARAFAEAVEQLAADSAIQARARQLAQLLERARQQADGVLSTVLADLQDVPRRTPDLIPRRH
jgi:UDP:flavonoid glycosyltransferase YjiC (YdhE family)